MDTTPAKFLRGKNSISDNPPNNIFTSLKSQKNVANAFRIALAYICVYTKEDDCM